MMMCASGVVICMEDGTHNVIHYQAITRLNSNIVRTVVRR